MQKKTVILSPLQKFFGEDFNPSLFIYILKRNFKWIILLTIIFFAIAYLFFRYSIPVYESTAIIIVKPEYTKEVLNIQGIKAQNEVYGELEVIKSKEVLQRALNRDQFKISYFQQNKVLDNELYLKSPFEVAVEIYNPIIYGNKIDFIFLSPNGYQLIIDERKLNEAPIAFGQWIEFPYGKIKVSIIKQNYNEECLNKQYYFFINNIETLVARVSKDINVFVENPNANTIAISLKDPIPLKASQTVNSITQEYLKYDLENRKESASLVINFINEQLISVGEDLAVSENQLKQFKKDNKIITPQIEETKLSGNLSQIESKQLDIVMEASALQWLKSYLVKGENLTVNTPLTLSKSFSSFSEYISRLNDLQEEKDQLLLSVNENVPSIKLLEGQISTVKNMLLESIDDAIESNTAKNRLLKDQLLDYEKDLLTLPDKEAEFVRLRRLNDIKEKFYLLLLDKRSEFAIVKEGITSNKVILEKALPSYKPLTPGRGLIYTASILMGLMIGFILIILKYFLHDKIISIAELERYCSAHILGVIPNYCSQALDTSRLVVDRNTKSAISEAFRSIRTNLQFVSNEPGPKVIVVTSTISGEGKTFVALNIGGILKMTGKKVIILDFDMRKPKIHKAFDLPNDVGLSNLLINDKSLHDCIQKTTYENFDIITSGAIPPNPAELINSDNKQKLIQELQNIYEIIIIDTPPIGIVTDAMELLKIADYPVYVLRANYSKHDFINNINKVKNENKIKKLSVVLNSLGDGISNYGYGHGYGYGYGYYSDEGTSSISFWNKIFKK